MNKRLFGKLTLVIPAFIAGMWMSQAARAELLLTPTITSSNGVYTYDYSIMNQTSSDLALVNLYVPTGVDQIWNLMAPTGFLGAYDTGLGIVTFLSDSSTLSSGFNGDGFSFQTNDAPGIINTSALTLTGQTFVGTASGPVPEPGSMALMAGAGSLFAFSCLRTRRKRIVAQQ